MTLDSLGLEGLRIPTVKRIEICGGIASGKTTLAWLMRQAGYQAIFENFRLNPFLKSFYSDPSLYSFETEISFLLQHYSQVKTEALQKELFISDYSLYLDASYAQVTLNPSHLEIFRLIHASITNEIGKPVLLIHLACSPITELKRIRNRHRAMERGITIQYLEAINHALEEYISKSGENILEIDSEVLDFAHETTVQNEVIGSISASIQSLFAR